MSFLAQKAQGKVRSTPYLLNKADEIRERGIVLLSAEKPTGKTVFSETGWGSSLLLTVSI